jgi:peptide/nickel transport system substrate-binding protein
MARVYDEFLRQRLSRRRLLGRAGTAALGASAIYLGGCGGGGDGGTNGASSSDIPSVGPTPDPNVTPTKGEVLRLRQTNGFPSLSPFGPTALASTLVFGFTMYDHLWYVPVDTGEIEQQLASDLEIIDEGMQVNVTLHEGFFHEKSPVNARMIEAQDVVESWFAFRDDVFGLGRDWLQSIMERLEAPSQRELIITQNRPWAWMFGTAGAGSPASSSVLPRETIDGTQFDLATDIAGSGRFFLQEHRGGQNLKLRAFDRWRIEGEPFLGGVDLVYLPEYTQAEATFAAGDLDQISFQNKLQAVDMRDRLGSDKVFLTSDLSRAFHSLMIKAVPPFDDARVWKAFRLAIDREEMIQLVERDLEGGVVSGIVPPGQPIYALPEDDPDLQEYLRYAPDEAQALLEEANFPFDQEFTLLISSPNEELADRAQVLKEQLSRIGVNVSIEQQDLLSVWVPRVLLQADYQMTLFTHLAYEDPYLPLAFHTTFSPIGPTDQPEGRNSMLFFDQEISDAVDASSLELELEPRRQKVEEAQRLIMQKESPMINIYSSVNFIGRHTWYKDWIEGRGSFGLFNGRAWIDSNMRG